MNEIFFAVGGALVGIVTGLLPGLHVNTVAAFAALYAPHGMTEAMVFIVAMSIVHTFLDAVPSALVGVPDERSAALALPAQRLFQKGKALLAIKLTVVGSFFAGILSLGSVFVFLEFINDWIAIIKMLVPMAIILVVILLILSEKGAKRKIFSALTIALSGALGFLSLGNISISEGILPMITGLFGGSAIIYGLQHTSPQIKQKIQTFSYDKKALAKSAVVSTAAGSLLSLLPSIGPSEAAFILHKIVGRANIGEYLFTIGGIGTANMIASFFVLYMLGKGRTGSAVAIDEILVVNEKELQLLFATAIFALGFAVLAADILSVRLCRKLNTLNQRKINLGVFVFLLALIFWLSGPIGILVFFVATAIGIIPLTAKIKRGACMACLMLPTLSFYLG